jgi:4'-phosphopantetheinyl transferase
MKHIDIWHLPFGALNELSTHTLSSDEEQKARKFVKQKDREQYCYSHLYLRKILSSYFPHILEKEWRFELNAYGRPELSATHQIKFYFNLSHTSSRAYVICSSFPLCGIDVEEVVPMDLDEDVLDMVLSSEEKKEFKKEDFFTYWTLKEAYIKALGKGLSIAMNSISLKEIKEFFYATYHYETYCLSFVIANTKENQTIKFKTIEDL